MVSGTVQGAVPLALQVLNRTVMRTPWDATKNLIKADLYRYCGEPFTWADLLSVYWQTPGFAYTCWLRLAAFYKNHSWGRVVYLFCRWRLRQLEYRYGISIPYNTTIGPGLYIGHYGGIVVNHAAVIGKNCNLNHGVTIGATYGGKHPGTPVIGDNVYIGPGSFVIGGIQIGNHVAIGANTVVAKSVPDYGTVVHRNAEISVGHGSCHYVVNTV